MLDRSNEDLLSTILSVYRLRAHIVATPTLCGSFAMDETVSHALEFHLIEQGPCQLEMADGRSIDVNNGDLILGRHSTEMKLCSAVGANDATVTRLICGAVEFLTGKRNPVLEALPDVLVVRCENSDGRMARLAKLLTEEVRETDTGSRAVVDKLADALFVMAVRGHLAQSENPRGVFAAMLDPRLRKGLDAIHLTPGKPWSVASLAEVSGMSRTAFAQRFAEVLGTSPIQYLTEWRMTEAEKRLSDPRASVALVAEELGYQTEAAFRHSFKRILGYGPGQARKQT